MASTPISGFPDSAVPPPVSYHFVMQDPLGTPGLSNYKISYADLAASIGSAGAAWGGITGTLSAQLDLQAALDAKVTNSINSGVLVGRGTAGVGVLEEIVLGTNLALVGNTLNASGGGGGFTSTPITVNVATPAIWAQVTVIDATVVPTSRISIFPGMTAETDMNDWIEGDVVFKATPETGQFIVDLYTRDKSKLFGDYKLQYTVG